MISPVQEGEILAGKYKVERTLGVGGMGVVVAAKHIQLEDRVALKFLLPEALTDPDLVARFAREARAAVKIKSEHVARVLDVGTMESGAPYMVMEYLSGNDLGATLETRGSIPVDEAVDFVLQACEAMAEAHAAGIIHRDLKPKNLFLSKRADGSPIVKVLDFGISKATLGGEDAAVTKTTAVMGSPLYMSPEQLRASRNVDARSDLWALGVILYELVCGKTPFTAPTMPQLCSVIIADPPEEFTIDVPAGFRAAVFKCLEKDPNLRYSNVADFAADIYKYGKPHSRASVERISRVIEAAGMGTVQDWAQATSMASTGVGLGAGTDTSWSESKKTRTTGGGSRSGAQEALPLSQTAPSGGKGGLFAAAGIAAAAIIAVAIFFGLKGSGQGATAAATTPSNTATPVPTATGDQAAKIELSSKTPGAKIFLDDAALPSNPYTLNVKPDGSFHKLRVEAAGYQTKTQAVVFEKATTVEVNLDPEATADPKKPAPPATGGQKPKGSPTTGGGGLTIDTSDPFKNK